MFVERWVLSLVEAVCTSSPQRLRERERDGERERERERERGRDTERGRGEQQGFENLPMLDLPARYLDVNSMQQTAASGLRQTRDAHIPFP